MCITLRVRLVHDEPVEAKLYIEDKSVPNQLKVSFEESQTGTIRPLVYNVYAAYYFESDAGSRPTNLFTPCACERMKLTSSGFMAATDFSRDTVTGRLTYTLYNLPGEEYSINVVARDEDGLQNVYPALTRVFVTGSDMKRLDRSRPVSSVLISGSKMSFSFPWHDWVNIHITVTPYIGKVKRLVRFDVGAVGGRSGQRC